MLNKPFTAFMIGCALLAPAALSANETSQPAVAEQSVSDATLETASKATAGQKILSGLKSLFSLNGEEDEAAVEQAQQASNELFQDIQNLKTDAIALNAELTLLEQELLFPVNTQLTVFVSLDTEELFQLESVRLTLDGKLVQAHLYSRQETLALSRGGMQRLHVSNLGNGPHELTAVFTGVGPNGRDYERATSTTVNKASGAQYIELHISDSKAKNQPEFQIINW